MTRTLPSAEHIAERKAVLDALLAEWRAAGARPDGADELEGVEEWNALALAAGADGQVIAPAMAMLALPWWLQRWLLQQWGMAGHIGRRLGTPG